MLAAKWMTMIVVLAWMAGLVAAQEPAPKKDAVDRFGDPLPEHAIARLGTTRFRLGQSITAAALSADGRLLAAGANATSIWDVKTGQRVIDLLRLPDLDDEIRADDSLALAFTSDNKRLARWGRDMKLRIAELATGKTVKEFDLKNETLNNPFMPSCIAFLPDNKQLLLKDGREPLVRLIDGDSGAILRTLRGEGEFLYGFAISPDGKTLAVGAENGTVKLWEIATGKIVRTLNKHTKPCMALAFAPDGKSLVSGGEEGIAYVWDVASGKVVHRLVKTVRNSRIGSIRVVDYAPDGKSVLTSNTRYTTFWDTATGIEIRSIGHLPVSELRFCPDGKALFAPAYGGRQSSCTFLDAETGKPRHQFDGHTYAIRAVVHSPDGKHIATADDSEFRVWDANSHQIVFQKASGKSAATTLAFNPAGDLLAAGRGDQIISWNSKTGNSVRKLPGQTKDNRAGAFSLDGTKLATGDYDGAIRIWDVVHAKELLSFQIGRKLFGLKDIAFSPDLRMAASVAPGQSTISLWDLATGRVLKTIPRRGRGTVSLTFSSDGRTLLETSGLPEMHLWEVATGQVRSSMRLKSFAHTVAFAPDGGRIAVEEVRFEMIDKKTKTAAARTVAIQIYDLASNRSVSSLSGHTGSVTALSFSPDGQRLVSASTDTTALLWDLKYVPTEKPAAPLTPKQLAACWADLGGDAQRADPIMRKLAADKGTIAFLRKVLAPAPPPPDAKALTPLIADMNSEQFEVRAKADAALKKIGIAAEQELRDAIKGASTLEARRRLEVVLQTVDQAEIRNGRAIEVLEGMNTAAARELLQGLLKGRANAWQTQEAQRSLDRLKPREAQSRDR